jgi:lipopolysaccharide/colanic/teichoic acid biosynthesis glycosyltransferase
MRGISVKIWNSFNKKAMKLEKQKRISRFYLPIKRLIDLLGSLGGLILLSPPFLMIALAIKIGSKGPILYRQERVGQEGRIFAFYKFRTMYLETDRESHNRYLNDIRHHGPVFKMKNDPRITPVGRVLRKMSLDELPILINVLKGDMSLVGPRPPIPYELGKYEDWHLKRLNAKPGITGLWQVSGRDITTFNEMVMLDIEYIENQSISLDLKILFKTACEVFKFH